MQAIDIAPATRTSAAQTPAASERIIAVASGKGGVGKTWFSITLAQTLASKGQKILLFDGDLGLANVDIQTGLNPQRDLGGVINGDYELQTAIGPCGDCGFDVVAGSSGSGSLAQLSKQRLDLLAGEILRVAEGYDRVVFDLGAGVEQTVRSMASRAGLSLVVTNDEPTAITDAYAFMKLGYQSNPNSDFRVVVNMAASRFEGERTFNTLRKACESFLQKSPKLAGVIRRDERVREAIRRQVPLLTRYPNTAAAEDVAEIAKLLSGA